MRGQHISESNKVMLTDGGEEDESESSSFVLFFSFKIQKQEIKMYQ